MPLRVSCLGAVLRLACFGGGLARSRSPPALLGVVCPPWGGPAHPGRSGAEGAGGGGGGAVCRPPRRCGRGAQGGGGSPYLGPALCLPWAGNKAGVIGVALVLGGVAPILLRFVFACCLGRGPFSVLQRWRGFACLSRPSWEQAVGGVGARGVRAQLCPLSRRRGPFGGRGDAPSAPVARGPEGGSGGRGEGRRAVALQLPPPGGWPVAPGPDPPSSPAHPPQVYLFGRGRWAAPGAGRGMAGRRWVSLAGGGGAACVPSSPEVRLGGSERQGVALPRSVPLPSLGRQQSGCHWRPSGHEGLGPHTAPVRVRVLPSPSGPSVR